MEDVELVVKIQQFLSPPKILLQFDRLIAFLSYFSSFVLFFQKQLPAVSSWLLTLACSGYFCFYNWWPIHSEASFQHCPSISIATLPSLGHFNLFRPAVKRWAECLSIQHNTMRNINGGKDVKISFTCYTAMKICTLLFIRVILRDFWSALLWTVVNGCARVARLQHQ